ncbi:sensor histidine kinase [Dyadobacter fermentans]|uniref:histidine kinase n=1 Tax=Dyadobacter fermentans (strain ATCC 700827 / DSM 18053 / CIP 107007 / KCTC 52180 / NS114) TaxID=471854 RepID=C6W1C2_DYAFD|nr:HAMP domain-containing sensor histidine kinase [Dyadobacter fermentans]ACT91979.1 histidine kinase [Dyadobacter fermentans DSM 18053]
MCVATLVVMGYVLIFSLAMGMITYAWLTAALIPLQLLLYYLSRVKGLTTLSPAIYSVLFHLFFVVSYRVSAGITGSTLLSLTLVYFCSLVIASPRAYLPLTVINLGTVAALLLLEYRNPTFVLTSYASREEHFIDIASTYAVTVITSLIGLGYIISNYRKEKDNAEERALLLDVLHDEKARLIAVISHDFNTPLISVKKYLDILGSFELTAAERQMLESELRQSVVNTQNLLMNLLDMTKSNDRIRHRSTSFNPLDAIEDTLKVYQDIAREKGVLFEPEIPDSLTLKGNPHLFNIVIRNLINNAVRACKASDRVRLTHEYHGNCHQFSVSDTGPGLSEIAEKEIMEGWQDHSMQSLRSGGLGLILAKKYAGALGGELAYTTEIGKGTVFSLTIPIG